MDGRHDERLDLARSLEGCADARSASRAARARSDLADRACVAILEDRFRDTVRSDLSAAAAIARAAEAVAKVDGGLSCLAAARGISGILEHVSGRPRPALRRLDRAVEAARAAREWARAGDLERVRVDVLASIGDDRAAREAARRASRAYRRAGGADPIRRASLAMNLGHLHHRTDRHRDALAAYASARKDFRRAGDALREAQAEYNRGNVLATLDRVGPARRSYATALAVFRDHRADVLVARAERALAELDRLEGRLDPALDRLNRVRERRTRIGDRLGVAHTDLERAEVLLRLNRTAESAAAAESARRTFRSAGRSALIADTERVLAGVDLQRGRPGAAARRLERAERRWSEDRNRVAVATARVERAEALRRAGDAEAAAFHAKDAARRLGRAGLRSRRARALAVAAAAEHDAGRPASSRTYGRSALRTARAVGDTRVELAALLALAAAERASGHPDREYRRLLSAERCVDRMRTGVRHDDSRLAFAIDKSEVYERLIRNRLERGGTDALKRALVFAERGKSRSLAEQLSRSDDRAAALAGGNAGRLLRRLRAIERGLAVAESRMDSRGTGSGIRSGGAARVRSLTGRRAELLARLARVAPAAATLAGARPPDPWSSLAALGPEDLVLEYVAVGGRYQLFAIERGRIRVFPDLCSIEEVDRLLGRLRFQLGKGVLGDDHASRFGVYLREAVRGYHERLFELLLSPVAEELDDRRVRVVPHGPLHGLPFHALERDGRVLVDRCIVSYAPSLTVLGLLTADRRRNSGAPRVLGVPDDAAPAIDAEVAVVRKHLGDARVFRGADTGIDALHDTEGRLPLLHVACHGFYDDGDAVTGGLRLGDAWVTLPEIYALPTTAELVVLSGCETGRGTVYSGDEWVGLVRGFLQAGARTVVASLWEVHDESAVRVMDEFYARLASGMRVGDALAGAQRSVRRIDAYPLHWAPFVVVGDADHRLDGRKVA